MRATATLRKQRAYGCGHAPGSILKRRVMGGHTKIESTVRYLGVEIDDAIEITEKIDV